jgi:nitroreductase
MTSGKSDTPLSDRFGPGAKGLEPEADAPAVHHQMAQRGAIRKFRPDPIPTQTLRRLCALALCAPTKSDLQQRDIIIIESSALRSEICRLLTSGRLGQPWLENIPNLLIFCGNNRRPGQVHESRGKGFANEQLDAFFNAVDAAIALASFAVAAEAEGLGICLCDGYQRMHGPVVDRRRSGCPRNPANFSVIDGQLL